MRRSPTSSRESGFSSLAPERRSRARRRATTSSKEKGLVT